MANRVSVKTGREGFTLIELLVVVLIIGILAAIAVPQYFRVIEKGRFAEMSALASVIKGSQERYLLKYNQYSGAVSNLDTTAASLKHFNLTAAMTTTAGPTYTFTMTRNMVVGTYGAYEVNYEGPAGNFICNNATCTMDLLP